jgi:hypothetical protein
MWFLLWGLPQRRHDHERYIIDVGHYRSFTFGSMKGQSINRGPPTFRVELKTLVERNELNTRIGRVAYRTSVSRPVNRSLCNATSVAV